MIGSRSGTNDGLAGEMGGGRGEGARGWQDGGSEASLKLWLGGR